LRDLWEKIEHSGHAVYIEMRSPNHVVSTIAGAFRIEQFDPQGIRHVAVIMLNPATIDILLLAADQTSYIEPQKIGTDEPRVVTDATGATD
jgi:hypothetical protein